MEKFDLIIIGAGRGSNLAVKAGKEGKKVALIEKSALGGTCPNRGCVPSKLLIGYAHVARGIEESHRHFIDASIQNIDKEKIFQKTNHYIASIDGAYAKKFNENVEVIYGIGHFESNNVVEVNGRKLQASKILIATGTSPIKPPHEKAWTSDDIFPLMERVPDSITIVGSGFIACELANFFDAIGVETKMLVRSEKLLSNEDEDISQIFKSEFIKNVAVDFNTTIESIHYNNETFTLDLVNKNGDRSTHTSDRLLYATGRQSNSFSLGLENTDIKVDERGYIVSDEYLQTTAKGVYVTGDANGKYMLQHAAAYEVNHLAKILLDGKEEKIEFKYMPHAVFTDPEIASVGLTEQRAKKENINYVAHTTDWLASAKAMSTRLKYPRTKFLINPDTYEILGCHMIGPESSTMMHQVLAVMHIDNDVHHLKEMLYIHPALSEAVLPAAIGVVNAVKKYKDIKNG